MNETISISLVQLAIALTYGADRRRGVARWAWFDPPWRARAARCLAVALIAVATLLWNAAEAGPAAFLAIPVTLMVAGTLGTLLASFWPRAGWALLIAAAPLAALLGARGGSLD